MFLLFQFIALLSAWALVCLAVYVALRLFGRRFRLALCVLGALALGVWCMVLGAFMLANVRIGSPGDGSWPYPFALVAGVSATLLGTMSLGGAITSRATQKQFNWLHGLLFCGLYLLGVHGLTVFALANFSASWGGWMARLAGLLPDAWNQLLRPVRISWGNEYFSAVSLFLAWIFPLAAPVLEIVFHSFKRAVNTNKTGSFT